MKIFAEIDVRMPEAFGGAPGGDVAGVLRIHARAFCGFLVTTHGPEVVHRAVRVAVSGAPVQAFGGGFRAETILKELRQGTPRHARSNDTLRDAPQWGKKASAS